MTRILFVTEAGDNVCSEIRARLPAKGLRELGYDVDVASVVFENADHKLYGFDHETEKQLPRPSILVVRHTRGPNGEEWDSVDMYEQARANGQRVFFDMDDDLWNIPDWNPATAWITPTVQQLVTRNVNACDGLIASTPAIAASAEAHGVTVPIHVIRNGVDPSLYTPSWEERRPIRLCWPGATNFRLPDLEMIVPALWKVLEDRYSKVEFWHLGWQYDTPSVRDVLGANFPVEIVEYPWVPIKLLPWALAQVDCVLLPQVAHPFAEGRSNDMGLHCAAAGVPFCSTDTSEYQRLFVQGAGYVVANDNWAHGISMLVDDAYHEYRHQMRTAGATVARDYNPTNTAKLYQELFG